VISGNTIQNISFAEATTNTSNCAIQLGASTSQGLFTVTGNSISNISVTLADATAEFNVITSSTAAIATIYGNKIFGLSYATATSAGNSTLRGINLSAGNTSVCYNNMISLGSGSETGNWTIYGIEKGTTNSTSFYFNTIYLYGTASSSVNSAAFKRTGSGTDVVKDNIFYNTRTPGTGSQAAIIINNNTTFTSDYNDLYSTTSATVGSVGGATFTDFSTWKSGSGQDANSKSIAVNFSSTTDLHLTAGSIGDVNLTGTPVGSITTDYDAEVRSVSFPYMGADENLSSPLPVELASFTGSARGRNVELLWNTATESNNNGFEVQKNVNGSWTKIGFVDGAGTSNAPHSYNFVYVNSAASKYSYRLKQIDRNGKFTYSNSVEVATTLTAEDFTLSQNYPNPFNPSTKFSFAAKSAERTTLKIYNVVGQEVATLFNGVAQPDQIYTLSFNAKDLPSGMYFYVLHSASRNEVKKMMLLK